ncbi:DUF748 domain-containing protein [Oryzomonas japonica]|uniref:DUF748 domain-containing protein n=1 Tax=Oryzomonas japonica TaxID=2603858 RepID=A0A7J4ZRG9_9BACT|nr:DUF748 domain-containing protein [Oryzomonas japonica]KAB0665778.1 DUF748 domain-containing protein [Oryzomonas japonica]
MAEIRQAIPWGKGVLKSRLLRWGAGIPAALALILFIASYTLDAPLRSMMEKKLNRDLKGYSVRLPGVHVQLLGLSLTLKGLTVMQQAHPETPVASFPAIKASIHWGGLLSGRLVAEFLLTQPKIVINLQQLRSEAASTVPLKERGWQRAVEDIYPLKINTLKIKDANLTYIDQDPKMPLVLSHVNLQAVNIRNIRLPDQVYPSTFHLDAAIFGTGRGSIDGAGNFLAEPYPGIKGRLKLEKVPIDYFKPVFARSNVSLQGGILQAAGEAEYAPKVKMAHLESLTIQGMKIDYIHSPRTAKVEKKRAIKAGKAARELSNKPGVLIRADQVSLTGCTLGLVNRAESKPYRIYLTDTDLQMNNFSNHFSQGPAKVHLKAKFMGSGPTTASATFRPNKTGPDLDLSLKIEESRLTAMNDVLRAYGDFDVSAGFFTLVTELHIKNNAITGYIKPFFRDMKVYDRRKDKKRSIPHQMYEILVGGVAKILENRPHQEVATKVDITGSVGKPETSTWQIVTQLIKNAFFKALLPSFEKEAPGKGKR